MHAALPHVVIRRNSRTALLVTCYPSAVAVRPTEMQLTTPPDEACLCLVAGARLQIKITPVTNFKLGAEFALDARKSGTRSLLRLGQPR